MTIRVLVVEDSLTVRRHLVALIDAEADMHVVGEAGDGAAAIELCRRLAPDVVTMDMMLPGMTGLAATEHIMAYQPTPILIVSASTNRGELFRTYDALAAGALDVVEKPVGMVRGPQWDRGFTSAVRIASRVKVVTHPRARLARREPAASVLGVAAGRRKPRLVALGASTGGPGAIAQVLSSLPPTFPIPILVVIHIAESFASALAQWLDSHSPLRVREARHGEALPKRGAGSVLLAPANRHLRVVGSDLHLDDGPELHGCRPSVDVLFESVAASVGMDAIAVLLTGMGRDGATGLRTILEAGGSTIAQDEASCVVFGMPGEAVKIGAAQQILGLSEIGPSLVRACGAGTQVMS